MSFRPIFIAVVIAFAPIISAFLVNHARWTMKPHVEGTDERGVSRWFLCTHLQPRADGIYSRADDRPT
jgi:hypothetical protein